MPRFAPKDAANPNGPLALLQHPGAGKRKVAPVRDNDAIQKADPEKLGGLREAVGDRQHTRRESVQRAY